MLLWLACVPKLSTLDAGYTRIPVLQQTPVQVLPQAGVVVTGNDEDTIALAVSWLGPMSVFDPAMLTNVAESRGFQVLAEPEAEVVFGHPGGSVWILANGLKGLLVGWLCPETRRLYTHLVLSERVWTTSMLTVNGLDRVQCHGHGDVHWRNPPANAPDGWTLDDSSVPNLQTWRRPDDREILQVKLYYSNADVADCDSLGRTWLEGYAYGAGMELFEAEAHMEGDVCMGSALLPGFWEGGRVRLRVEECAPNELLIVFHTSVMGEETPWVMSGPTCD